MATQRLKLYEVLGHAGEAKSWSIANFTCVGCRRRVKGHKLQTPVGAVCVSCVESNLKIHAKTRQVSTWDLKRILTAVSDDGDLTDRLPVLWKYHEALRVLEKIDSARILIFYRHIVRNLGFVEEHPLAQAVRQAAYQACVTIGDPILPSLLDLCHTTPWQFYANVAMVAGTIAPYNDRVQALLKEASQSDNPEVSGRAFSVLQNIMEQSDDKAEALLTVVRSLPKQLRELVQVGLPGAGSTSPRSQQKHVPKTQGGTRPARKATYLPRQKEVEQMLDKQYSADALKKIYGGHMEGLVDNELHPDAGRNAAQIKKASLAWLVARVYTDKALFRQFYERLPDAVQSILQQLVWEGGDGDAAVLEKTYGISILRERARARYSGGTLSQDIFDDYTIFQIRREYRYGYRYGADADPYHYQLSLPDRLRPLFKHYLPHPPQFEMLPLHTIQDTAFQYADGDHILQQLPLLYSYIEQGHLNFSKSTGKVLKSSIKQMKQYCHIEEFYDDKDKDLGLMRTKMLIEFCRTLRLDGAVTSEPDTLRKMFEKFFSTYNYHCMSLTWLIWHLQGVRNLDNYYGESRELPVRHTLSTLLRAMPAQEWLDPEDLAKYCLYHDLTLEVAQKSSAARYLSYKGDPPNKKERYYYDPKRPVTSGNYGYTVMMPFFKGALFLLASFGLVDLAYDEPVNDLAQRAGRAYLSPFDGLRYVRLTPLGAYVAGQTDDYDAQIEEEHAEITLDDNRLLLTIEGQDRMKQLVIEKIAEQIGASCYRVNYQTFLRECKTTQDIEKSIELFHAHICADPPEIWQEFLQDVLAKINPLQPNSGITVYKLAQNRELHNLFARDSVLKKYIMKAEDFHIAIESKHLSKVKKRLEEFGYLIDNL